MSAAIRVVEEARPDEIMTDRDDLSFLIYLEWSRQPHTSWRATTDIIGANSRQILQFGNL